MVFALESAVVVKVDPNSPRPTLPEGMGSDDVATTHLPLCHVRVAPVRDAAGISHPSTPPTIPTTVVGNKYIVECEMYSMVNLSTTVKRLWPHCSGPLFPRLLLALSSRPNHSARCASSVHDRTMETGETPTTHPQHPRNHVSPTTGAILRSRSPVRPPARWCLGCGRKREPNWSGQCLAVHAAECHLALSITWIHSLL